MGGGGGGRGVAVTYHAMSEIEHCSFAYGVVGWSDGTE